MSVSQEIKKKILEEAEKDYKEFSAALIPNINNVLGVRIPVLRKLAKDFFKNYGEKCLEPCKTEYMEEIMVQGMVIGLLKKEPDEILKTIESFVPKIDNWAVCDIFCGGLKFTKKNKELVWDFLQQYLQSDKEYYVRFGLVMLLSHFVDENYIDKIFKVLDNFNHEGYYARMAAAWLLSICYVKFPQKTDEYLKHSKLDNWTYNKGIQKICESLRVDKDTKIMLKSLKRR